MICRHCGRDSRLSKAERSARQREAMRASLKRPGSKRRLDYALIKAMRDGGWSMKDIARVNECTVPGVSRALNKCRTD
jgi:CRP-like cAMP-binding protein